MAGNLYELLEVNETASPEAISANFKRLHAKYAAPAASGDEGARNQLIALREAHDTLSDLQRRQRYDQRLAARSNSLKAEDPRPKPFLRLIILAIIVGVAGLSYAKHSADQEKVRLEREKLVAATKLAEIEAQKEREEKQAADQAERQRRADEARERNDRARDTAYSAQITRDIQRAETQGRYDRQREEQQRANEERQRVAEANRQLAKDKAYLRQLEADSTRTRY